MGAAPSTREESRPRAAKIREIQLQPGPERPRAARSIASAKATYKENLTFALDLESKKSKK